MNKQTQQNATPNVKVIKGTKKNEQVPYPCKPMYAM